MEKNKSQQKRKNEPIREIHLKEITFFPNEPKPEKASIEMEKISAKSEMIISEKSIKKNKSEFLQWFLGKNKKRKDSAKEDGMERKIKLSSLGWKKVGIITVIIAVILFYINFRIFTQFPQIFAALNGLAVVIALAPPVYIRYHEYRHAKAIENMFPAFMQDITENINVGMSLTKAIRTASGNDYGPLSSYVKEMAAKIDWGISFEKVLMEFSRKVKSPGIGRIAKGIIEAHRSGGTINTVLKAMTSSVRELERIKKERATHVYSQMITGYFIFFLFLGIMLAMAKLLVPLLTFQLAGAAQMADISQLFAETFRSLVVIQGIFAGLSIGKMSEGTITAGFKHSFVLTIIGYTTFVIF